ncbi:MAG: hypothetical protein OXI32_06495 [bacterium]|nr:hypothetical protein [bacterium]
MSVPARWRGGGRHLLRGGARRRKPDRHIHVTQQPDDIPANTTTPGAVPVGGTAPGRIEA